ncbi:MAG: phosphoribosylamine--glycine ligase, partial [Chloroflexi bacterium]
MPTRVIVVGSGGREHALAWKLAAEPGVNEVIVAPGSAAIAREPRVRIADIRPDDAAGLIGLARARSAELVVVGPEGPLAAGVADALATAGIAVFGPTKAAAAIETSKAWCHEVAAAAGVAMAPAIVCDSRAETERAIGTIATPGKGFVVKDDGLAAGKGVTVFDASRDPIAAAAPVLDELFDGRGPYRRVVVEERLSGSEASVIAACDGRRAVALPAARDHKRLLDGDHGPNTGGMGAYSPLADLDEATAAGIVRTIHLPILEELARRGTPFRGFLYAGLMLTVDGPRLLEMNVRLGDPEAEVILPRLAVPLGPLLLAASQGRLPSGVAATIPSLPGAAVGIVLAGEGYPTRVAASRPIDGLDRAEQHALVFHMGTRQTEAGWETSGGRVLTIVGRGPDVEAARAAAEHAADGIHWPGMQRRRDIASA